MLYKLIEGRRQSSTKVKKCRYFIEGTDFTFPHKGVEITIMGEPNSKGNGNCKEDKRRTPQYNGKEKGEEESFT
jgi:hypothetical protein